MKVKRVYLADSLTPVAHGRAALLSAQEVRASNPKFAEH